MAISDEKRREVAENLQNLTIGRSIQYKEQFFDELAEVVVGFEDYHDFNVVLEKLADLIDRPTTHIDVNEHGRACCANCGCDDWCLADRSRYCPNCGAEVAE